MALGEASFGGIRAGAGARAAVGAYVNAGTGMAPGSGPTRRQPGSPYTTARPTPMAGPAPHHALLALVALEVVALLALRGAFRYHHGG